MSDRLEIKYRRRKYLSVSTLISFARCHRKYFYEKNGLRSPGLQLAPIYGSALHQAVPVALDTEDITLAMEAFLSGWVETEEQMDILGDTDKKRNRTCAKRSLEHFIFTHRGGKSIYKLIPPPEGAIPLGSKTSKFEVPWSLDIGLRVPLAGFMDSLCEHRDTKEPWIWELKSTSSPLGTRFFDAHEMYIQNLTYTLVGQTMNVPIAGVMLEGLHVSHNKVDNQVQMIPVVQHHIEDVLGWLQRTGQALLNAEDEYASRMEELEANVNVEEFKITDQAHDAFPKDFTGCTPYTFFYSPGFRCDFADLCRVPDWRQLTDLYNVVEDHDMFQDVTVEGNAI